MSRWGGEETKSQGIFGCAFAGLLLLIAAWGLYKVYPELQRRSLFEKEVNLILRSSRRMKLVTVENKVMESAKILGIHILREDLDIERVMKDKYTPVVSAKIPMSAAVDFGWGETNCWLPSINATVTLVSF